MRCSLINTNNGKDVAAFQSKSWFH